MARIVPIRIMERDKQEYRRLRRNAQAKLRRVKKRYGVDVGSEVPLLPIDEFATRQQFNKWKEDIQSFTNRGNLDYQFTKNQYGVVARVSQVKQLQWDTEKAQRHARQMIDTLADRGTIDAQGNQSQSIGERFAMQLRPSQYGISMPSDFDFENIRSDDAMKRRIQAMQQKADEGYYIKRSQTMRDNFANLLEADAGRSLDVAERIRKMSGLEFYELQQIYFDVMDFELYYNDLEANEDNNQWYHKIEAIMDKHDRGDIDYSLSIFK